MQNYSSKSDEELAELLKTDDDALAEIIDRYQEKLDRYIRRISNINKEDREDVLQEVFLSVYENINSYDSSFKFSSWIYRITHNKVISLWRKNKNTNQNVSLEENLLLLEQSLKEENNILKQLEEKENAKIINKALESLPVKYKEPLVLYFIENKSYEEISDILQMPVSSVGTRIRRAKEKIKKQIEDLIKAYE